MLVLIRRGLIATLLVIVLPLHGDSSPAIDLCRLVPDLDPGFVRHIVLDEPSAFRRYCDGIGQTPIREAYWRIDEKLWTSPPDSYVTRLRMLGRHLERLGMELATRYGSPECLRLLEFRRRLGSAGIALNRLVDAMRKLGRDGSGPLDARIEGYRGFKAAFERMGFQHGVIEAEGLLAKALIQQGETEEGAELLRSALDRARRTGGVVMICQYLGEMGYHAGQAGLIDSMLACYREGIAIADHHRLPEQAMRLRRYLAGYYVYEGKLAVAMDLVRDAQRVCRRWGGGPLEVDVVLWAMEKFADLGCWDVTRELSRQLPVLLRALERSAHRQAHPIYSLKARRLNARLLLAEGKLQEAGISQSQLWQSARREYGEDSFAPIMLAHADALLAAGRAREAKGMAAEGMAYADSFGVARLMIPFALIRARAALALGELEPADSAVRRIRARLDGSAAAVRFTRSVIDAFEVGLSLARGHQQSARRRVERGLMDLRATVRRLDPTPHAYLGLAGAEDLREVAHRLLAEDAESGYRLELDWRSLPGQMGRSRSPGPGSAEVDVGVLNGGDAPSIHAVYGFVAGQLTRWTLASGTVRRERLAASRRDCDRRVDALMRLLDRDPGSTDAPLPDSVRVACSELGRLLLPPEVRAGRRVRVVVSAEGSIARLPFEVLDVGSGTAYEPLIERHDVVYARPVLPIPRRAGDGTSLILLDGAVAAGAGTGGATLAAAGVEVAKAGTRLPNPRVVFSGLISKQALVETWARASVLYVAAHLVRDRETPMLCHFPMRFGARPNHLEDTYLDLYDARTVDLSRCELAVLSSCASGEPYVVEGRTGPSMADVLLDAGAGAVIHTRWQVRDDRAAILAPRLAEAWLEGRGDPVAAWCAARRAMLRNGNGWRHPFEWGAWSVSVRLPVSPWRPDDSGVTALAARPGPFGRARPGRNAAPSESPR